MILEWRSFQRLQDLKSYIMCGLIEYKAERCRKSYAANDIRPRRA